MVLEPYNLIRYVLSKNILRLERPISDVFAFEINKDTERNIVVELQLKNGGESLEFITKQPRILENEGIKYINNERTFYNFIDNKIEFVSKFIYFDEDLKIIFIKKIADSIKFIDFNNKLSNDFLEVFKKAGNLLKSFHDGINNSGIKLSPFADSYSPVKFIRTIFTEIPFTQKFDYGDSTKFPNYYDFISNGNIRERVLEIVAKWDNSKLIHGDFHHRNILITQKNELSLIDFELVGYGDLRWDLACFIYSVIIDKTLLEEIPDSFLNELINAFLQGYDLANNDVIVVKEFVALKAIWDYLNTIFVDSVQISLKEVEAMLNNPETYSFTKKINAQ